MGVAPSSLACPGGCASAKAHRAAKVLVRHARKRNLLAFTLPIMGGSHRVIVIGEDHSRRGWDDIPRFVRKLRRQCAAPVDLLLERPARQQEDINSDRLYPNLPDGIDELFTIEQELRRRTNCRKVRGFFSDVRGIAPPSLMMAMGEKSMVATLSPKWMMTLLTIGREAVMDLSFALQQRLGAQAGAPVLEAIRTLLAHIASEVPDPNTDDALRELCAQVEAAGDVGAEDLRAQLQDRVLAFNNKLADTLVWLTDAFTVAQLFRPDGKWAPVIMLYGGYVHTVFTVTLIEYVERHNGQECESIDFTEVKEREWELYQRARDQLQRTAARDEP